MDIGLFFGLLLGLFGLLITLLWLVIAWRAMRAHEKLARAVREYVDHATGPETNAFQRENALQHKLYRKFQLEDPEAAQLPPKERHARFRTWLAANHGEGE